MAWFQTDLRLAARRRGFHLITPEIEAALREMPPVRIGLLHVFIQHTSASLSINENADPNVPRDLEMAFNEIAREDFQYGHTAEGPDDMPAHVKAPMVGSGSAPGRESISASTATRAGPADSFSPRRATHERRRSSA